MNAKHLVFLFLLLARPALAENHGPSKFYFETNHWGPDAGSMTTVTYKDGGLSKTVHDAYSRKDNQTIDSTPTAAQWLAFRKTLDEIGVWNGKINTMTAMA